MRNSNLLLVAVGILIVLDLYVFQAVKVTLQHSSPKTRMTVVIAYWLVSVVSVGVLLLIPYIKFEEWPKAARIYVIAVIIGLFLGKIIASVFFLLDDIRRLFTWIVLKLNGSTAANHPEGDHAISRSVFLSWLGLAVGGTLFGTLLYGFSNKYRYQVRHVPLAFKNLPPAFKGLRILQISDIHSGSFMNKQAVMRGIEKIHSLKPDLILFTGDLVNDRATEMHDYIDVFKQLSAPMGVYSTLGNHDYGDYARWESLELKAANLERLKQIHAELGWRLLMNEHVALERNGDKIALIGIENWSARRGFSRYGKMELAYPGAEKYPFKILMSHDPSHWDAQVRTQYPDVDLMLAGHTHGMQFGVDIPGLRWSPVQYVYKQWVGLYEADNQKLYVNRGYGFIGYPGRVGILPEITVIELS